LARAFVSDPVFTVLFPTQRRDALVHWFTIVEQVLGGCRYAQLRSTPQAAAIWTTAACPDCLALLDERLSGLIRVRAGGPGIDLVDAVQAAASPRSGPFLHWLGVLPEARGTGAGRALLAQGGPAWTTTCNPGAVPFYRRCGWTVAAERAVAGHPALTCWTLCAG
jgi:GNAT superfamily N-acetyltransferase